MAREFLLTKPELHEISGYVVDHFDCSDTPLKAVFTESSGNGKWGMARLWRKWMEVTAQWMASNGATMPLCMKDGKPWGERPFSAQDAHELFTSQWLGLDIDGKRMSWQKKEGANVADKGQRFLAMLKHQEWCIEKGINLPVQRNSEFNELLEKQNE